MIRRKIVPLWGAAATIATLFIWRGLLALVMVVSPNPNCAGHTVCSLLPLVDTIERRGRRGE